MDVTLKMDHLPLQNWPLNSNVNGWPVEISLVKISFEYIRYIKDTHVDTMSGLIKLQPQIQLEPENLAISLNITHMIH